MNGKQACLPCTTAVRVTRPRRESRASVPRSNTARTFHFDLHVEGEKKRQGEKIRAKRKKEREKEGDRSKRVKSWTCRLHNKKLIKRVRRERKRERKREKEREKERTRRNDCNSATARECCTRSARCRMCATTHTELASRCDFAMNHAARCTPMRRPSMVVPAVAQDNH